MKIGETYYNVELSDILDELAIQLQANGIQLLQKRNNLQTHIMVQCPYHSGGQEKKPSAGLRKDDGKFHCFACGEIHSLPEVISFCFGKDDDILGKFGNKWLLKNFSHLETESRNDIPLDMSRSRKHKRKEYVSEDVLDKYRYTHPYMYERGLDDEIIETFDIGYDKSSDCITFPVRDIYGNTLFVATRAVKTKRYHYPEGVEKPLYGIFELYQQLVEFPKEVIVCEGMFDALKCWVFGKYAVALNGLGNDLQFRQLRELPCRELILATDMDKAGLRARKRIREEISNKIIAEYRWNIKDFKDIGAMSRDYFLGLKKKI